METFKNVFSMGRDKLISGIKYVYSDINSSTLTGAIDIIVIEQPDGTFKCGPFHVRFGKMGILKPADKIVDIHLNGYFLDNLHMKLGKAGEAYFVESVVNNNNEKNEPDSSYLAVSPLQSDSEDVKDDNNDIDLSQRALSVENINSELLSLNFSRSNGKKRLFRRFNRVKNEEVVVCVDSNNEGGEGEGGAVCGSEEDLVLGGYNSDGIIDEMTKEERYDRNMTWDWGNFPLENPSLVDKSDKNDEKIEQNNEKNKKIEETIPKNEEIKEKKNEIKKSNNQLLTEVYLEDIVKEDVSEEIKREFIYETTKKTRNNASNEASVISSSFDAGYKSDGESNSPSHPSVHELRLSLCGDATSSISSSITDEKFFKYLISFEDFMKEPDEILKNPNLVVLLNGKYYNWFVAAPILVSIIGFRSELPLSTVSRLKSIHMPEKRRRTTWFSWRRQEPIPVPLETVISTENPSLLSSSNPETASENSEYIDKNSDIIDKTLFRKKIRLSNEEIIELNLKPGRNDITFSMTTKYQGTTCAHASIYLWKWYDKIVISDVDGTITKSDVLGHVLPILGHDWTQLNVVKLFKKINRNNYRFIYLSARAIGQSGRTRTYLQDVIQDDSEKLPDGPILLSPTSLFQSLHREVIEKKPEYFKIQCLNDVRSLFPEQVSPLYAGFGNRINDVIAYKAVGIDQRRIFTVNHEGILKNEYCQKWSTSYGNLSDVVDFFFQYYRTTNRTSFHETAADFTDVNYWTVPIDEQEIRNEINKMNKK